MALIGRLHPIIVHFPIALVIIAALAEGASMILRDARWHFVAVVNVRAGAFFAVLTALAGWLLAQSPTVELTPLLTWHRWVGITGVLLAVIGALSTSHARRFRAVLFVGAAFIGVTGHLGGLMVWGSDWFRF